MARLVAPTSKINVVAPGGRQYTARVGGSILADFRQFAHCAGGIQRRRPAHLPLQVLLNKAHLLTLNSLASFARICPPLGGQISAPAYMFKMTTRVRASEWMIEIPPILSK
jgi:hypothetical protein